MMPSHIAIILDGNGRWASKRLLPHSAGHRAGAQALRKIAEEANRTGIKHMTVYALSTENWARPRKEVDALIKLMHEYIQQYIDDSEKNDMRVSFIGDMSRFASDLQAKMQHLTEITHEKRGLHLHLALNYGGRDEIVRATRKIAAEAAAGRLIPAHINEETIARRLDAYPAPYPDLLIRTGGEMRLSNFLLWQLAYAEFYMIDKLWPDFDKKDLHAALEWFGGRQRRFGGRSSGLRK